MIFDLRDGGKLYYEVHGDQGQWLILLNGIMMNTKSWHDYIPALSKHYRLIVVDFRDQSQSSKLEEGYDVSLHVSDLVQLFDYLGINQVNMFGVSYGGLVAMDITRNHQDRLKRLMLMSIVPKATNHFRAIGEAWRISSRYKNGADFFAIGFPFVYSEVFYEQNLDWLIDRQKILHELLTEEWFEAFLRLSDTTKQFDYTNQLKQITVSTLLICGSNDFITPTRHMEEMSQKIPNCIMLTIPKAGHGAVLETPKELITAINGFMLSEITSIEKKDTHSPKRVFKNHKGVRNPQI